MENQRIQIIPYDKYLFERVEGTGHNIIGYDKNIVLPFAELFPNGKPIRFGLTWDKELETMRPDWNMVSALGRKWEKEARTKNLQKLVRQYQAKDESVLPEIENSLEVLAYSVANDFSFKSSPDTAVFLNEAGEFDKYIPKAPDTEDPEDEKVEVKKMYVRFVPFSFSDEDIGKQFPKSVKTALETYNPDHKTAKGKKTLFSTWFFRRFKLDLKSLYKKYKGDAEKIKDEEEYDQKGLSWSNTFMSIPDKTDLSVGDFTIDETRWMSLILESYPYELSVDLRCRLLNIKDRKTDKNLRNSLVKKLDKRQVMYTENRSKDTYLLPKNNGVLYLSRPARTRPPAEFKLYKGDKLVGYIILNNGLLTVKGHADPTPAAVARAMDTKTELPKEKAVPVLSNWYKDKDGLRLLPGVTGKYNAATFIKDVDISYEPTVRQFYVYNHTRKVYCKNLVTRSELLGYLAIRDAVIGAGYLKPEKVYKISKFSSFFRITQ